MAAQAIWPSMFQARDSERRAPGALYAEYSDFSYVCMELWFLQPWFSLVPCAAFARRERISPKRFWIQPDHVTP